MDLRIITIEDANRHLKVHQIQRNTQQSMRETRIEQDNGLEQQGNTIISQTRNKANKEITLILLMNLIGIVL